MLELKLRPSLCLRFSALLLIIAAWLALLRADIEMAAKLSVVLMLLVQHFLILRELNFGRDLLEERRLRVNSRYSLYRSSGQWQKYSVPQRIYVGEFLLVLRFDPPAALDAGLSSQSSGSGIFRHAGLRQWLSGAGHRSRILFLAPDSLEAQQMWGLRRYLRALWNE